MISRESIAFVAALAVAGPAAAQTAAPATITGIDRESRGAEATLVAWAEQDREIERQKGEAQGRQPAGRELGAQDGEEKQRRLLGHAQDERRPDQALVNALPSHRMSLRRTSSLRLPARQARRPGHGWRRTGRPRRSRRGRHSWELSGRANHR